MLRFLVGVTCLAVLAAVSVFFFDRYEDQRLRVEAEQARVWAETARQASATSAREDTEKKAEHDFYCRTPLAHYRMLRDQFTVPSGANPVAILDGAKKCGMIVPDRYYQALREGRRLEAMQ